MGHAKLINNDNSSSWPDFLKALKNKSDKLHDDGLVVIDMHKQGARKKLEDLVENKKIQHVVDNYDEQLAELLISRDAHLYKANEDVQRNSIAKLVKDHYGGRSPWELGSWVYFGWTTTLVHILDKRRFFELRTIRNRDLISSKEQEKLASFKVACAGMSVGSSGALALVLSGISHDIKLADGAVVSGSNLNRILAGVETVGKEKALVIARKMYEMNPYLSIEILSGKLDSSNAGQFLELPWQVDLVIDEIDDLEMKIRLRVEAKKRKIPVIMATELADTIMLDVERYDLEPNRPLFHGLIKNVENLLDNKVVSQREWMKHATSIIGTKNVPLLMQESLLKIGSKIVTHPQLGSTAMMVGGIVAFAAKQISLGRDFPSQRTILSLEKTFLPEHRGFRHVRKHKKHTRILKKSIGSM